MHAQFQGGVTTDHSTVYFNLSKYLYVVKKLVWQTRDYLLHVVLNYGIPVLADMNRRVAENLLTK